MSQSDEVHKYVFGIETPKPMEGWPAKVTLDMQADQFALGWCEMNGRTETWYVRDLGDKWVPGLQMP